MIFKAGDRVRVRDYPDNDTHTVIGQLGTVADGGLVASAFVAVRLDSPPPLFDTVEPSLFRENELELWTNDELRLTGSEAIMYRESGAPNADRIAALEADLNTLDDGVDGLVGRVLELEGTVAHQYHRIAALETKVGRLERNLDAQIAVNSSLTASNAEVKALLNRVAKAYMP